MADSSMSSGGADNWMEKETKEKPPLAQVGTRLEFKIIRNRWKPSNKEEEIRVCW